MALKQGQADWTGTTASAALPSLDRTTRFIARLDDHLRTLADDASRRALLDRQLEGWEHRYARFIATEGDSVKAGDPVFELHFGDRTRLPQAVEMLSRALSIGATRPAVRRLIVGEVR